MGNSFIKIERKAFRDALETPYFSIVGALPSSEEVEFIAAKLEDDQSEALRASLSNALVKRLHNQFVKDELPKIIEERKKVSKT